MIRKEKNGNTGTDMQLVLSALQMYYNSTYGLWAPGLYTPESNKQTKATSGLEPDPSSAGTCKDFNHNLPDVINIPPGMRYRHLCSCGYEVVLYLSRR